MEQVYAQTVAADGVGRQPWIRMAWHRDAQDGMPSRRSDKDSPQQSVQNKLASLVRQQCYSQAIRLREQALRRQPDLALHPSEADLWRMEGQLAATEGQIRRAETALRRAIDLGLHGEPEYQLARLRLHHSGVEQALEPLQEAFNANTLPADYGGAYLKLLLLQGDTEQVRQVIRTRPERFQPQQIHWAGGILQLLDHNPAGALQAFRLMVGPASPGDQVVAWRAWAQLEAGDHQAAAAELTKAGDATGPMGVAVALDLAARDGRRPGELLTLTQPKLPQRGLVLALELLFHLRRSHLLTAAKLLLEHERQLLSTCPALAVLRRPLLLLAGQQALEQDSDEDAIRCWRPIVDRPGFDPDLALRLYPVLDRSMEDDDNQEAERLANLLISWVRRASRAAPDDWPQALLNRTLARLHCWQADQFMVLGARQQARRSVQQAEDLASGDPEVVGRRGMLQGLTGDVEGAIPLLWQALDGGCRCHHLYTMLAGWLEIGGQREELKRLQRTHGAAFDDHPHSGVEMRRPPFWLKALSECEPQELARRLERAPDQDAGVRALLLWLDHISPASGSGGARWDLEVPGLAGPWSALLAELDASDRVEAITAILLATYRHCRRRRKIVVGQIEAWHDQLEQLATDGGSTHSSAAQRAQLMLLNQRLRPGEAFQRESRRLLGRTARPERTLALALMDLRLVASTRSWRPLVEELHRQDPQEALLLVALATMEPVSSALHRRLLEQGFALARQQQDQEALAACHWEEQWSELSFDRKLRRQRGAETATSPEMAEFAEALANLLEDLQRGEPPQGRGNSRGSGGGRRKTFKDL